MYLVPPVTIADAEKALALVEDNISTFRTGSVSRDVAADWGTVRDTLATLVGNLRTQAIYDSGPFTLEDPNVTSGATGFRPVAIRDRDGVKLFTVSVRGEPTMARFVLDAMNAQWHGMQSRDDRPWSSLASKD